MKLKKLLSVAVLLAASALGFNAKAQESGTYYIQNVESGKWFVPYNDWGTRASVYEHADYWKFAKLSDGVYNLESVVSNGGSNYYLKEDYCDGGASNIYFTPVEGKENVYNISTDQGANYYTAADKLINRAQDPTALSAQWKLYTITDMANLLATATALDPIDATFLIKNHNLSRNNRDASAWINSGATDPKTSGTVSASNSVFTVEAYQKTFDYSQTLTDIPNGIYALRVNCFYRQDGSDTNYPYLYAGTKDNKVTFPIRTGSENDMQQAAASFVAGKYLSDPVYVEVTDGTLLLGTATDGTTCWSIFKNFHLQYYGNVTMNEVKLADYVKIYKEAMDAAKTYQSADMFDEDKTALNTAISENTLDLSTATEESLTTATNNLKAAATAAEMAKKGYLEYFEIEQILTNGAGSATIDLTSILTNPGFETGNTEGWTNSGSITAGAQGNSSFDNKKGSYYAERWHTVGTVDINQTLHRLPAGIYKISAYVYSDTPDAILYANDTKVGFSTSGQYSVLVEVSDRGSLKFGTSCTLTGSTWICLDEFTLTYMNELPYYELAEGKMELAVATAQADAETAFTSDKTLDNYNALLAAINDAKVSVNAYASAKAAIDKANAIKEANNIVTAEATATFASAIKNIADSYEASTLTTSEATNAGLKLGVVVSGHKANKDGAAGVYMESAWDNSADFADYYINTWSTEGENDGSNFKVPFFEYWVSSGSLAPKTMTATVEGLAANEYYKVSLDARVSYTSKVDGSITMTVSGGSPVDITTGAKIGDSDRHLGTFSAYGQADADGKLTVSINVAENSGISWLSWQNIKNEVGEEPASAEDYATLATAIETAEGKTIGFMAGEYAPYNNIDVVKALAAAKLIDNTAINAKADVTAAIESIADGKWSVNSEEVNAVYNGDFALCENNGAMAGWTMSNNTLGGSLHSRAFVGDSRLAEFNSTNSGAFLRFDGTNSNRGSMYYYGRTEGYTMPLKANTTYYVSVDVKGWGSTGKPIRLNVTGPEGFTALGQTINTTHNADTGNEAPQNLYIVFTTGEVAGNYVINFQVPGSDSNKHNVVVSNVKLFKATAANMTITEAGWATFIAPFEVEIPEGVTAYTVAGVKVDNYLNKAAIETGVIPANTPVLLEGAAMTETFYGQSTATEDTYGDVLVGNVSGETMFVPNNGESFVLLKQDGNLGFYKVATDDIKVGNNRCYLNVPAGGEIKAFFFDDEATGINGIADDATVVERYNAAGMKVAAPVKGLNIVKLSNGKVQKVLVK